MQSQAHGSLGCYRQWLSVSWHKTGAIHHLEISASGQLLQLQFFGLFSSAIFGYGGQARSLSLCTRVGRILLIDFHDRWLDRQYCDGFPTLNSCLIEPISSWNLSHVHGQQFASNPGHYRNFSALMRLSSLMRKFPKQPRWLLVWNPR